MPSEHIDPVFAIVTSAILWSIYIFGPKIMRKINAKKLDNTWNTNQFDK